MVTTAILFSEEIPFSVDRVNRATHDLYPRDRGNHALIVPHFDDIGLVPAHVN